MVTMNIVGAGFKPAPTKNKKDIIESLLSQENINEKEKSSVVIFKSDKN